MTYDRACEILGFTTPKSMAQNAKLAESRMDRLAHGSPLRYQVACQTIIKAAH